MRSFSLLVLLVLSAGLNASNIVQPTSVQALVMTLPAADAICAHGADSSIAGVTCTNSADASAGVYQNFATTWSQAASFWITGRRVQICGQFGYWSNATTPTFLFQVIIDGATQWYAPTGNLTPVNSKTNVGFEDCFDVVSADAVANVFLEPSVQNVWAAFPNSNVTNAIAQPLNLGAGSHTIAFGVQYSSNGIASGTYTSGGSITGTVGQTCTLSAFIGTGSGTTATVALTGTNVIAGGTALVITNTGVGTTGAHTSATLGNGTATCSGTATITTVLGGAQGNALKLQSFSVTQLN